VGAVHHSSALKNFLSILSLAKEKATRSASHLDAEEIVKGSHVLHSECRLHLGDDADNTMSSTYRSGYAATEPRRNMKSEASECKALDCEASKLIMMEKVAKRLNQAR
jgi:hypothetical protein